MRIAMATEDGSVLAHHTERCFGFAVYDIEKGNAQFVELRENRATAFSMGLCHEADGSPSTEHSHASLLELLSDCDVLISRGMGQRLARDLQSYGIKAIFSQEESVVKTAALFAENQLTDTQVNACTHKKS